MKHFRKWWQIPRSIEDRQEHRQVTFLELFYDLVYVALIAQLSHDLSSNISGEGLLEFAFLFIIVWWAWINGTLYHELHGNDDVRTRVFTFLQMGAVVSMAIFAHNAIGENSMGFALSYAAFQLILTVLWWRTGIHDENHKVLSGPYALAFIMTTALFIASVFVSESLRYQLWAAAIIISLLMPLNGLIRRKKNLNVAHQLDLLATASPSLVERFGLFTIIVLGEVIIGVVNGTSSHGHITLPLLSYSGIGGLFAAGLWWLYFDFISHRLPKKGVKFYNLWFYLHLPLTMSLAALGAALLNVIANYKEGISHDAKWMLVLSIAIVLICITLLTLTIQHKATSKNFFRNGRVAMLVSAALLPLSVIYITDPQMILSMILALLFLPILVGFLAWIKTL